MNQEQSAFALQGLYRVQGSLNPEPAQLQGVWLNDRPDFLNDADMNMLIRRQPLWQGRSRCTLRAARVSFRLGQFASRPDILYKMSHFAPSKGTPKMPANIVDLPKALSLWQSRQPFMEALFGVDGFRAASVLIGDMERAIVNEYMLHEAGHCLGYAIGQKTSDRYFSPGGEPAAFLIALEELRADAHGFQLALELLSVEDAVSVFLYYLMQRFSVHLQGLHLYQRSPYGLIPYLLYDILQAAGFRLPHGQAATWPDRRALVTCMRDVSEIVNRMISVPELEAKSPVDAAIVGATYVRERVSDEKRALQFQRIIDTALFNVPAECRALANP
jgi:hypothetical protein